MADDSVRAYIDPRDAYVLRSWQAVLAPLGVTVLTSPPATKVDLWYEDYDSYDFDARDACASRVYSYVYRKALTRKNYLDSTIRQHRAKRPQSALHAAWPDTFCLDVDYPEFLDDALDECWDLKQELAAGTKVWILKPALGDRAFGIAIFRTQDELQQVFDRAGEQPEGSMRQYVVQEYVCAPMLIDGRKFHVRVYCACVGKLRVYVSMSALLLFSSKPYTHDYADLDRQLTNTCFQGPDARVDAVDLRRAPVSLAGLSGQVAAIVRELFEAAMGQPTHFQPLPNAFEFFGLDFLVGEDGGVRLLEVNAYPDFKQTGALTHVVDDLFADTAALVLGVPQPLRVLELVYSTQENGALL